MPRSSTPARKSVSQKQKKTSSKAACELIEASPLAAPPRGSQKVSSAAPIADIPAPADEANQGVTASLFAILIFWSVIIGYSVGVSRFFPEAVHWYEMILHYFAAMLAFYAWHWQAHRHLPWIPFNVGCRSMHMQHHWQIYPPQNFYGKEEADHVVVTHNSFVTAHEALLYVGLVVVLAIARLVFGESWEGIGAALVMDAFIGFTGNWLHQTFHVKGHWLERFDAFHELRAVHYVHHLGTTKINYAVFNIGLDYLFGSLLLERPKKTVAEEQEQIKELRSRVGGLTSLAFGLQYVPRADVHKNAALTRGFGTIVFRAIVVAAIVFGWFQVENFLAASKAPAVAGTNDDFLFKYIPAVADCCIARYLKYYSTAVDTMAALILLKCVFGYTIRPLISLGYGFLIREVVQIVGWHAGPAASLWAGGENVSIFANFDNTQNALSGGILLAAIIASEARHTLGVSTLWIVFSGLLIGGIAYIQVALRAEYTSDLLISFLIGRYVTLVAHIHAPVVEGMLP